MSRRGESRLVDALPDLVSDLIDKIASLALLAVTVTLIYFLYALFSGYVGGYGELSHDGRLKVIGNLQVAANIFMVAAIVAVGYVVLRLWEQEQLAVGLAGTGAALYFGAPFVIAQILGKSVAGNRAALTIQSALTSVGTAILVAAVVRAIPALASQLKSGFRGVGQESTMRRAARVQNPGMVHPFSPCWRLPYCRPYIRDKCIRYREKKTCWRIKRGCLCDDDIMAAALMGGAATKSGAREQLILEYLPGAGGKPTVSGRRLKCQNCFIYLDHQRIKHKYAAPLTVPLVIGAFWVMQAQIDRVYEAFGEWAVAAVQRIALGEVNTEVLTQTFTNLWVERLVLLCIGIYVLTYLLRFLEYVFFRLKL